MIINSLKYLEPVYRGRWKGTNFEFVSITANEVTPQERKKLEEIAKKYSYILGFLGQHKQSEDNRMHSYRGIRNQVTFIRVGNVTDIYISGRCATGMGLEIEHLPFVEFLLSKEEVVQYSILSMILDERIFWLLDEFNETK